MRAIVGTHACDASREQLKTRAAPRSSIVAPQHACQGTGTTSAYGQQQPRQDIPIKFCQDLSEACVLCKVFPKQHRTSSCHSAPAPELLRTRATESGTLHSQPLVAAAAAHLLVAPGVAVSQAGAAEQGAVSLQLPPHLCQRLALRHIVLV